MPKLKKTKLIKAVDLVKYSININGSYLPINDLHSQFFEVVKRMIKDLYVEDLAKVEVWTRPLKLPEKGGVVVGTYEVGAFQEIGEYPQASGQVKTYTVSHVAVVGGPGFLGPASTARAFKAGFLRGLPMHELAIGAALGFQQASSISLLPGGQALVKIERRGRDDATGQEKK